MCFIRYFLYVGIFSSNCGASCHFLSHSFISHACTSRITLSGQNVNKIERQRGKFIIAFLVVNIYELLYTIYSHDAACDTYDG